MPKIFVNRKFILIVLIILVGVGVFVFSRNELASVPNDPEGFKKDQQAQIQKNTQEVLERNDVLSEDGLSANLQEGPLASPISIPTLQQKKYDGRDFTVGKVLEENQSYIRYYVTYSSDDLTISGIMNVPKGTGPFPLAILNHGYIDPAVYTNGRGLRREQDYLARQGFVVIHSDYRNHAQSSKDPDSELNIRIGYIEDVINLIYAVKAANLSYIDSDKIGMLGHSMGGGVAQGVMVSQPGLVDAFVLYAPVSMDVRESFNRWTKTRPEVAKAIIDMHGSPESSREFWDNISPITFIQNIQSPVLIFHGTSDADVPIDWSRRTRDALVVANKSVELIEYPGQPHEFTTTHTDFMRRTTDFFKTNLK